MLVTEFHEVDQTRMWLKGPFKFCDNLKGALAVSCSTPRPPSILVNPKGVIAKSCLLDW